MVLDRKRVKRSAHLAFLPRNEEEIKKISIKAVDSCAIGHRKSTILSLLITIISAK